MTVTNQLAVGGSIRQPACRQRVCLFTRQFPDRRRRAAPLVCTAAPNTLSQALNSLEDRSQLRRGAKLSVSDSPTDSEGFAVRDCTPESINFALNCKNSRTKYKAERFTPGGAGGHSTLDGRGCGRVSALRAYTGRGRGSENLRHLSGLIKTPSCARQAAGARPHARGTPTHTVATQVPGCCVS